MMIVGFDMTPPVGETLDMVKVMSSSGSKRSSSVTLTVLQRWIFLPKGMKSTKVQNPRRIQHILRTMPMRVHRACAGFGQKLYACALFIIDGLGHATWSSKMPISRSGTAPF